MADPYQFDRRNFVVAGAAIGATAIAQASPAAAAADRTIQEGFADSNGVKIHYASVGSGPLVVMIHGFPDYWYTWRKQMAGLGGAVGWQLAMRAPQLVERLVILNVPHPRGFRRELVHNPAQTEAAAYARAF